MIPHHHTTLQSMAIQLIKHHIRFILQCFHQDQKIILRIAICQCFHSLILMRDGFTLSLPMHLPHIHIHLVLHHPKHMQHVRNLTRLVAHCPKHMKFPLNRNCLWKIKDMTRQPRIFISFGLHASKTASLSLTFPPFLIAAV